mmetsp:Transcript_9938/g.22337  ORF Transcript_9938/g.22337 Transcript_9938/m.22337 type:complete len:514 (-) Transcript_9938:89-1630(-)
MMCRQRVASLVAGGAGLALAMAVRLLAFVGDVNALSADDAVEGAAASYTWPSEPWWERLPGLLLELTSERWGATGAVLLAVGCSLHVAVLLLGPVVAKAHPHLGLLEDKAMRPLHGGHISKEIAALEPKIAPGASRQDPAPISAWPCLCCTGRPRVEGDEEGDEARLAQGRSAARGALGAESRPWIRAQLHPKFCGARLQEPSGLLPELEPFPLGTAGDVLAAPAAWGKLLRCTQEERVLCSELKARLAQTRGPKDPVTLLRFLRARQGRVAVAAQMYERSMVWREETQFERGFREGFLDDRLHHRLSAFWPPTAILGQDSDGDPIYWNRMGLAPPEVLSRVPAEFLIRHEVYTITRILQALEEHGRRLGRPVMYMTVVVDMNGLGMVRHLGYQAIQKYKACVRTMEDNFPEMVKRIIVVNVPSIAFTFWKVANSFFDEGTRDKVQFADQGSTADTLARFMDKRWIPEALGGSHRINGSAYCYPAIPCPPGPPPEDLLCAIEHDCARGPSPRA